VLPGWKVQPLPPYAGALVRLAVTNTRGEFKSVYLDVHDRLGSIGGEPYWEVSPVNGEPDRCGIDDIDRLVWMIEAPRGDRGPMVDRFTGRPA
jgi:hypothetical protein